jgi:uncharacterized protein YecE (DUF72 family)
LPVRRWLEHYSSVFDTVEVNATFYRLATRHAVESWVRQTPEGFVFAVKASRYLTHVKRLRDLERGIERFYAPLEPMREAGKLGPVLWQLPENFHRDDERLEAALTAFPPGRHCVEFRHESWFVPEVEEILRRHAAALVIGDHPERPFQTLAITAPFTFVRFHYGSRGRRGNYSERELAEWARRIAGWRSDGIEVFAYFNNDWEAFAPKNARKLKGLLCA